MINFIKRLFCIHNYVKINGPAKHGTWKCIKCKKKQYRELDDFINN